MLPSKVLKYSRLRACSLGCMENDPFLNPSSELAARLSATRTASAGICAFSLFSFLLGELPESVEGFGGGVDDRSEGS